MIDSAADDPMTTRRSRGFVLGYGAAQAGAFICFIPLLTLLLPEKAEQIGGADKALLLGQAAMLGGLAAAVSNLLFGALSDGTKSRLGRRRPWILAGFAASALALAMIGSARDPFQLAIGVVAFQLAVNALYAPLMALVPDMVPNDQKGLVCAWTGIALPIANLFTALVVSRLAGSATAQFAVVIAAAAVLVLPFALTLREPLVPRQVREPFRLSFVALKDRTFRLAFSARLLLESAVAINTLYLFFFLQAQPASSAPEGWSVAQVFGALLIASTLAAAASGFAGGILSDRLRQRRAFVFAGGAGMAVALALFVGWPTWPGPLIAQLLFGIGHGLHATAVAAMTAQILPDPQKSGRDLGVMNMAVALPQGLAPACAVALLGVGFSLSTVFAAASGAALLASAILMLMRRVP
jgi:MFS family permease